MKLQKMDYISQEELFELFPDFYKDEIKENISSYQRRITKIIQGNEKVSLETLQDFLFALPEDLIKISLKKKYFEKIFNNVWISYKFNLTSLEIKSIINLFDTIDLKLIVVQNLSNIIFVFYDSLQKENVVNLEKLENFFSIFPKSTYPKLIKHLIRITSTKKILEFPKENGINNLDPYLIYKIEQESFSSDQVSYKIFSNHGTEKIEISKENHLVLSSDSNLQNELLRKMLYLLTF